MLLSDWTPGTTCEIQHQSLWTVGGKRNALVTLKTQEQSIGGCPLAATPASDEKPVAAVHMRHQPTPSSDTAAIPAPPRPLTQAGKVRRKGQRGEVRVRGLKGVGHTRVLCRIQRTRGIHQSTPLSHKVRRLEQNIELK